MLAPTSFTLRAIRINLVKRVASPGPSGAGLLMWSTPLLASRHRDIVHRAPVSSRKCLWEFALGRIARLMKDDRDKNFIDKNKAGTTVNRWTTTGMLAASASSSETAYLT